MTDFFGGVEISIGKQMQILTWTWILLSYFAVFSGCLTLKLSPDPPLNLSGSAICASSLSSRLTSGENCPVQGLGHSSVPDPFHDLLYLCLFPDQNFPFHGPSLSMSLGFSVAI